MGTTVNSCVLPFLLLIFEHFSIDFFFFCFYRVIFVLFFLWEYYHTIGKVLMPQGPMETSLYGKYIFKKIGKFLNATLI